MSLRNTLILVLFLFTACDKSEDQVNGIHLSGKMRTLTVNSYGQGTYRFIYDADQHINAIHFDWILDDIESTRFEIRRSYSWEETADHTHILLSSSNPEIGEIDYYLNRDLLLDSIKRDAYVPRSLQGKERFEYQYDTNGSLTGLLRILYAPGLPNDTSFYYFKQDEHGNIVEEKYISTIWEGNTLREDEMRFLFEYDNHPNPFHHFPGIETMYGVHNEFIYFNKNNITSVRAFKNGIPEGDSHYFQYLYNHHALPSQIDVNTYMYKLEYY